MVLKIVAGASNKSGPKLKAFIDVVVSLKNLEAVSCFLKLQDATCHVNSRLVHTIGPKIEWPNEGSARFVCRANQSLKPSWFNQDVIVDKDDILGLYVGHRQIARNIGPEPVRLLQKKKLSILAFHLQVKSQIRR